MRKDELFFFLSDTCPIPFFLKHHKLLPQLENKSMFYWNFSVCLFALNKTFLIRFIYLNSLSLDKSWITFIQQGLSPDLIIVISFD